MAFMSKEEIALEAWNLLKRGHTEKLPEEDIGKLYQYMIILLGDDSLYEILKDSLPL